MPSARRLLVLLPAVIAVAAVAAAPAYSVTTSTLRDGTASGPLTTAFNGASSSASTLTTSLFGISVTLVCTGGTHTTSVSTNPGSPTVTGTTTAFDVGRCTNQSGTVCTTTALGLPWPTSLTATSVGSSVGGTLTMSGYSFRLGGSGCLPFSNTCTYSGTLSGAFTSSVTATAAAKWSIASQTLTSTTCASITMWANYNEWAGVTGATTGLNLSGA